MTLAAGVRLGPYEILSPLGAGGMGEVYRARDTRLGRDVAIKVLPEHLSTNVEFKQRFEREAKAVSQLSHPHVCALYDVGNQDGVEYLVMELLEGQVLSERLARGPLSREQVFDFGKEIADALEAAHRRSLVHRDLKPGNVMITRSGVKLLDFGLAKAIARPGEEDVTSLPTEEDRALTERGTVLGTFQYMAPEQLEGKPADARTDIFALGCVLYEMATGRKAFTGTSRASLITAIMSSDPAPISTLQPMTPPALDRVVRTCLAKDPDERWQSAHDVKSELAWIGDAGSQAGAPAVVASRRRSRERFAWAAAALFFAAAIVLGIRLLRRSPAPMPVLASTIPLPPKMTLPSLDRSFALSPDGRRLVVAGVTGFNSRAELWTREMDGLGFQPLAGTEGAYLPFWSPDGRFVGFFAGGKLKKIPAAGGTVAEICDAPDGRGASWSIDDVIVFAPTPFTGLFRVAASGGTPEPLTRVEPPITTHRMPNFLPDGRHLLFYAGAVTPSKENAIYLLDLRNGKTTLFTAENSEGRYVEPGYLLFVRDRNLMAQPMDARDPRRSGEAVPIAGNIRFNRFRSDGWFSASETGLLVFEPSQSDEKRQLKWFGLDGKDLGTVGQPVDLVAAGPSSTLSISPDGRRAAGVVDEGGQGRLWVWELARGVANPFAFGKGDPSSAVWSPDGRFLCVGSDDGNGSILVKPSDGSSDARAIATNLGIPVPADWSPDGKTIVFHIQDRKSGKFQLYVVASDGTANAHPFLAAPANEMGGKFSPDGRWLAFSSDESGRMELYVAPFPGPGEKQRISTEGAQNRGFCLSGGRQIAFVQPSDRKLVAVDLKVSGSSVEVGQSHLLFGGAPVPRGPMELAPDGGRFLIAVPIGGNEPSEALTLVANWPAGLAKK